MRMIPAKTVQSWLNKIINELDDVCFCGATHLIIEAGEEMGIIVVNKRNSVGEPTDITWPIIE